MRQKISRMHCGTVILLIGVIALLAVLVAVLLWRDLSHQQEIRDKNDAIIREIRENVALRDELRRMLKENINES